MRSFSECAALSYGDVREFFLRTPCRSVTRIQPPLRGAGGGDDSGLVRLAGGVFDLAFQGGLGAGETEMAGTVYF